MDSPEDAPARAPSRMRALALSAAALIITIVHFLVPVSPHPDHVVHVIFGGLYVLVIVAAAIWFGLAGATVASVAAAIIYLVHIRTSWRGQPMENANQYAMIGVYLLVGALTGTLVHIQRKERERHRQAQQRANRNALLQALASLSNALGARDGYTEEHSERVARLAVELGRRLGLDEERLDTLRLAGLVHDVGKIGVRDDILLKPDRLSAEERRLIERHPEVAARILRPIRGVDRIAEIVLAHHECPDGSGYPRGLRGEEILTEARVLRVADVFSALTDSRSYKPALGRDDVLRWMHEAAGTKLDAEAVAALEGLVAEQVSKAAAIHGELAPVGRFAQPIPEDSSHSEPHR